MENKYFMHRIKLEDGNWDKGIEIHDTYEKALASYHAYLGSYAYDNPKFPNVTFVSCMITDIWGNVVAGKNETWQKAETTPEPEA